MRYLVSLTCLFLLLFSLQIKAQQKDNVPDSKKLEKALDYFSGEKYHEALMLFIDLDKRYKLNPRFKAYIGICYYYEWEYKEACKYIDGVIENLDIYSPQERNIYYKTSAESHFILEEYEQAIPLYEQQLLVCQPNEKGDAYYRLGFCYMFKDNKEQALEYFTSALEYYRKYSSEESKTRIVQLEKMIKGLEYEAGYVTTSP
ncbi:MAG: tetratricopeptide repeat protein [Prevotellaceae bacterium]|nr:tetratricopeptide repeat protein [Prevotellaceae bacterium]